MALHHRPELENIRFAYNGSRSHRSETDSEASYHSGSLKSYQTAPTEYSSSPAKRQPLIHHDTHPRRRVHAPPQFFDDGFLQESPRSSAITYASTVESEADEDAREPEYHVPEYMTRPQQASYAVPAMPSDFSTLFPSTRRLTIHHDDSTPDGNMNLRVDTDVSIHGQTISMTLFHLRMHDLKQRKFSLRRYCRDSGREICHTELKQIKTTQRPSFQRSLSNVFSSMRTRSDSKAVTLASAGRNDSGYGSMHSFDINPDRPRSAGGDLQGRSLPRQDTVKLEFSNYAQLDVKRTGSKGNKRYEFEYWGTAYAWRRVMRTDCPAGSPSFHLVRPGNEKVLAYIMPTTLTSTEIHNERIKGGWISPSSMWIADDGLVEGQQDVADVVIASGLIALVDDCIRRKFQSKHSRALILPLPKSNTGLEYIGPRRLISEMLRRNSSGVGTKGQSTHSPLTQGSRPSTSGSGAVRPVSRVSAGSEKWYSRER